MLTKGQAVTLVALELGYDRPSAFIAVFQRALGASQTRYLPQSIN
jgi:AraC-like DNA-binding protein